MQLKPSSGSGGGGTLGTSGEAVHMCPYCNYSSVNEARIKAHVQSQHTVPSSSATSTTPSTPSTGPRTLLACPLCQEKSPEKTSLENHLMQVHSVSREGLAKLMLLVEPVVESPPPAAPGSTSLCFTVTGHRGWWSSCRDAWITGTQNGWGRWEISVFHFHSYIVKCCEIIIAKNSEIKCIKAVLYNLGCMSLLLPRLPKLPSQCYSNEPGNLGNLTAVVKRYSHQEV